VTYDPKAKRPVAEPPSDEPAPVDELLGAGATAAPTAAPTPAELIRQDQLQPDPKDQAPTPTRRTPAAIAGAVAAVIIIFLGWRRFRR
jgi:hypothetical protein